jgi:hypothetical protein
MANLKHILKTFKYVVLILFIGILLYAFRIHDEISKQCITSTKITAETRIVTADCGGPRSYELSDNAFMYSKILFVLTFILFITDFYFSKNKKINA